MEGIGIEVMEVAKIHAIDEAQIAIKVIDGMTVVLKDIEVEALGAIKVHKDIKVQIIDKEAEAPTLKDMEVEAPTLKDMIVEAPILKDMRAEAPTQ